VEGFHYGGTHVLDHPQRGVCELELALLRVVSTVASGGS
jgi:hypothetical protein